MKKYLVALIILVAVGVYGYFLYERYQPEQQPAEAIKEVTTEPVKPVAVKDPNTEPCGWNIIQEGQGASMEPTLKAGMKVYLYCVEPKVNDMVHFYCSKPECHPKGVAPNTRFGKRLIKIREDGAWWVLGDNREHSFDSGDYGWILPSQRSEVAVMRLN